MVTIPVGLGCLVTKPLLPPWWATDVTVPLPYGAAELVTSCFKGLVVVTAVGTLSLATAATCATAVGDEPIAVYV